MRNAQIAAVAAACALLAGGCAYHAGSGDYRGYQVMGEQSVRFGVVESVREVHVNPRDTGTGTAGGAILGGIAGSNVGDTVLDPFFGTGTVGLVALETGRLCVGIELKEEFATLARERLLKESQRPALFR